MRFSLAITACLGLALVGTTVTGPARAQSDGTPGLLVLDGEQGAQRRGEVRILRGSAIEPRRVPDPYEPSILGPGRWQVVAGERFWLFDRQTRKLASCRNRGTANVGEREIECTFGTFGRYRRTFGNNFPH